MDALDQVRVERLVGINSEPRNRDALEAVYGRVWDTAQLTAEFEVLGFLAPFVVVQRRSDRQRGSLEFQISPRLYFNLVLDTP